MVRRGRRFIDHCCYHITHRCHNRDFLFRFSSERNNYLDLLRDMTKRYRVAILNYMITSNHVHLLVWSKNSEGVSAAMRYTQGTMAQKYNRKKSRQGSFWRNRYHSTLIENGIHLGRCLFYIDFNMVRAGVVDHPSEWKWSGYHELSGNRKRYRIINQKALLDCFRMGTMEDFCAWYNLTLQENLEAFCHCRQREAIWSEALAVGSQSWVEQLSSFIPIGKKQVLPANAFSNSKEGDDDAPYTLMASKKESSYFTRSIRTK